MRYALLPGRGPALVQRLQRVVHQVTLPTGHRRFRALEYLHVLAQADDVEHLPEVRRRLSDPHLFVPFLRWEDQIEKTKDSSDDR